MEKTGEMIPIDHDRNAEHAVLSQVLAAISRQIDSAESLQITRENEIGRWSWGLGTEFKRDGSDVVGWLQAMQWVRNAEAGVVQAARRLQQLRRQLRQPYFGQVDFRFDGEPSVEAFRIGVLGLSDSEVPVYDWRTPIASLYYDAEPGSAAYRAPTGLMSGTLIRKRQYLIRDSQLQGVFDTTLPVGDEVLQQVLAVRADARMGSIVSTIQRQQNQAIRMPVGGNLVVEGPAGSGKTSVALQRVAYVLYRERQSLTARNILFLSPSRLFADYISQVLPELGEDNPILWSFEDLMGFLFPGKRFQSRFESVETTWSDTTTAARRMQLAYKASMPYLEDLEQFLGCLAHQSLPFRPIGPKKAPWVRVDTLQRWFTHDLADLPAHARLDEVAARLEPLVQGGLSSYRRRVREELQSFAATESELSEMVEERVGALDQKMQALVAEAGYVDWPQLYRRFYLQEAPHGPPMGTWDIIRQETLRGLAQGPMPYEDQAGMLWLRGSLVSERALPDIRLLVIDEAQDYTLCQYAAMARIFRHARLTAVGDVRQVLSPGHGVAHLGQVLQAFVRPHQSPPLASAVCLRTTYRSSPAIMAFARQLLPDGSEIEVAGLGRSNGSPPTLVAVDDPNEWARAAARLVQQARTEHWTRIGIITRTVEEARRRAAALRDWVGDALLLDSPDTAFAAGVVVLPLALAKGLEFDAVVVADISDAAYSTAQDRLLLYTVVTRAVHRLWLITLGSTAAWMPRAGAE